MAIGDGNISNPNGRTYRLRITCDIKYPKIINRVKYSLEKIFPKNKVSYIKKKNAIDISVYNKSINNIFGWKMELGKKINQKIIIPKWITADKNFIRYFIKGLFESDGSIYKDRKYLMANFVSYNKEISYFVYKFINSIGFTSNIYKNKEKNGYKYTVRISKNTNTFIKFFKINKS